MSVIRTPLDGGGVALSAVVTVDDGARVALLELPGLLRFDVCPDGDTLRTVLRNLTPDQDPIRRHEADREVPVVVQGDGLEALGPRPAHLAMRCSVGGHDVEIMVATRQDAVTGRTTVTGQALALPA